MANSLVKLTLESNQYEKGLQQAQRSWNQFTKGIGLSVGKFTAVSAAIGAVSGALKVAKDAFFNNEQQLDEWGRAVSAAESTYQGFLSALNNGDIGGFLSNIDRIVNAARSAYNAIDELATYNAFNRMNVAEARANMSAAIGDFRMGNGSKEAVQESVNKLKEELGVRQTKEWDAYIESVRKIATERGANPDDVVKLLGGKYVDFENVKKSYVNESSFSGQTVKSLFGGATVAGAMSGFNFGTQTRRTPGTDAERLSVFARSLNDTELDKLQAMGEAAQNTKREIADLDKQLARVLNGRQGGSSGGSGGRSGGGGTKTELTEMQSLQKQIRELEQEYIRLGGITTEEANKRKSEIQTEISARERQINQLKLYEENAHGRLLGGSIQKPVEANVSSSLIPTIDQIREQIAKNPIIIPIQATQKDIKAIGESAKIAASMVGTIGQAFNAIEDPAAKVMGTVAQAIATVALAYADTLAKDQSSKSNIWAFIAAAAASTVSMIATIASIHQATGYAHGGEIKGNTYSNDQIPIMANAGEVVLTRAMQGNLASQLNAQSIGGYMPSHISGEQIYIALNRYVRRSGRGEIVTWKY